jgi:hypothetical protein
VLEDVEYYTPDANRTPKVFSELNTRNSNIALYFEDNTWADIATRTRVYKHIDNLNVDRTPVIYVGNVDVDAMYFNDDVKCVLKTAFGPSAARWGNMTAWQMAEVLAFNVQLNTADVNPVVANAIRLANLNVQNIDDAAKELVVTDRVNELSLASMSLASMSLKNENFNADTKRVLMKAMKALDLVADASNLQTRKPTSEVEISERVDTLQNATAEVTAEKLAKAGLNAAYFSDPVVASAIRLADKIAHGDDRAAKELVATDDVVQKMSASGSTSLQDTDFNAETKRVLMKALVATGMVVEPSAACWTDMTAENLVGGAERPSMDWLKYVYVGNDKDKTAVLRAIDLARNGNFAMPPEWVAVKRPYIGMVRSAYLEKRKGHHPKFPTLAILRIDGDRQYVSDTVATESALCDHDGKLLNPWPVVTTRTSKFVQKEG